MCKFKRILIVIFFSVCIPANAQSLKFDNYTSKDGLVSDDVYKMFQDQKGYMWFFTNYGTMKYNGKKFEQVLKNLPFSESFIYSYYENNEGKIWVANSNAKIYEVKNDSAFQIKGTEAISELLSLKASEITELYVDKHENIYISSKYDGFKCIKEQGYKAVSLSNRRDADSVFVYALDIEGHIFNSNSHSFRVGVTLKADSFLLRYINEEKPQETYKLKFWGLNKSFSPLNFKQFKRAIYFSYNDKLLKIRPYHFIKPIPFKSFVLNYTLDKNGHLWVGLLNGGLYELDQNDSVIGHYFENKTVNHVYVDSGDGLWVSTEGSGVFRCSNLQEMHFKDSAVFNAGISLIKKIENKLFIATSTGNICMIDSNGLVSIKMENDNSGLLDIVKYHSNYIIYSRQQVKLLEIKNKLVTSKLPTILPGFLPIHMLRLGGDTLLCFSRNEFTIINHGVAGIQNKEMNIYENVNRRVFSCALRGKEIVIGTNDGACIFINNKLVQPDFLSKTKDSKIIHIIEDREGNFWFCTLGQGLFKLSPGNELMHYHAVNGLPSDIINNLSFGPDNEALLSTNKGLFESLDHKKWNKLYTGQVRSAYEHTGKIYLVAENKLVIIDKHKAANHSSVYFNLVSVLLNGKNSTLKNIRFLEHDQNNLTFNFDVISYSSVAPDIIYHLKGEESSWDRTSDQQIVFQNLPPGDYVLTIGLALPGAKAKPFIIPFNIAQPFWEKGWFICLCILVGLTILIFIGWTLIKYFRVREVKKNEIQQQISEYKLIALKAQINPHFMSNCLTAIQHLIFNNKVDAANEYLAKFSLLVRQVLNFSSKPLITLKEELEVVVINIELEQLRFENKFTYEIDLGKDITPQNIFVPPLIFQPIIENAIWHGLLPLKKTRNGKLKITIHIKNDLLYIQIEDNGVGRKLIDGSVGNLQKSKGIDITKQRIQNLNVYYNKIAADLVYEDLVNDQNYAVGTRVTVILPLNLILEKK